MILQRLVEHYDRLLADASTAESLPKAGYSEQKVSFCVVLNPDGTLQKFQSLLDTGQKRPIPRRMQVPGQAKPSGSGINPCFLWDNAAYMLGFVPNDGTGGDAEELANRRARALQAFEAFRAKHIAIESQLGVAAYRAVCHFLKNWSPQQAELNRAELIDITGSFGVFRIAGEQQFVHEDPAIVDYWVAQATSDIKDVTRGVCLVTGREGPIARLHEPKIKGAGGQSSGALLVSFNEDAYTSFGKDQSFNAPVSVDAAFKYTNALNHLLNRRDRRIRLADTTVVFWAEKPHRVEQFVSELLGDFPDASVADDSESRKRLEETRLFISQLREGHAGVDPFDPEDRTRFFILGLAPNAARLSVRFWVDSSVAEMKERLAQHLRDIDLVGARDDSSPLTIRRLVAATGRAEVDGSRFKGYDTDSISPLLAGAVARAVLSGGPYPQTLLRAMLDRLRADGEVRHERVAAIKACLVRSLRMQAQSWEVPVALDTERTEAAYVTGRLFALLEKIQKDSADGDLNATIKDRYFGAASATPSFVFPRLIRLSQHHLAKMETGRKIYYEKQVGEVMNKLSGFAHHLRLEDQGLFAVGYYHQQQDLYTSKKSKEEGEE